MTFQSGAAEECRIALVSEQDNTSGSNFQIIPHAGNPTGPNKVLNRQESDEVRSDLQVTDHILTGASAAFGINNPARPSIYDILLQMVMGSAWSSAVSITGTDIASAASGNKFTSATTDKFNDLSSQVPCPVWITRDGGTAIANYAIAISVVTGASPELVIGAGTAGVDFGVTLTDVSASDNVEIMHSGVLKPGTTNYFAIVERAMTTLTQFYAGFGMMCTSFTINMAKGSIPTYAAQFEGRDADDGGATYGTGTETAASTSKPFNAAGDVVFGVNGLMSTAFDSSDDTQNLFVEALELTVESAAIPTDPMGILGRYAHDRDTIRFSGSFTLFANDDAQPVQARAGDDTDDSLFFGFKQVNSTTFESLIFWAPRIQYNTPDKNNGGRGNKVRHAIPFMSSVDSTYGLSGCIARFTGAPVS